MPIDPSIPLGVRPPQPIDVTRGFEQGARLARLAAITQQEQAEMALKQRELAEQEQIRAVLQESQGNLEAALPKIRTIAPMTALKIEQTYNDSQSAKFKLLQNRLAHDLEATEYIARQLNGVTDQQSYDYARAAIAGAGLPVENMNPQYDPQYIESLKAKGLSVKEQLDLKKAEADRLFQERKFQAERQEKLRDDERQAAQAAESARHARAMEGISAGQLAVARGNLQQRITEGNKPGAAGKAGPDVAKIMGEIETLSNRINTSEGGITSTITGAIRRGKAAANYDNDVAEYESLISGMIPMVARAVGHTGVLTQQDVDSVRNLFPRVGDNATLAKNKMARVKGLIQSTTTITPAAAPSTEGTTKIGRFTVKVK